MKDQPCNFNHPNTFSLDKYEMKIINSSYLGTGPVDDTGRFVGGIRFPSGNMSLKKNKVTQLEKDVVNN